MQGHPILRNNFLTMERQERRIDTALIKRKNPQVPPSPLPQKQQKLTQFRAAYQVQKIKVEETESMLRNYYSNMA